MDAGGTSEFISQVGSGTQSMESLVLNFRASGSPSNGDVEIIGTGRRTGLQQGRIDAGPIRAGETKFVRLRLQHGPDAPVFVDFYLGDANRPYNGFTIRAHTAPARDVAARNMREWIGVMMRSSTVTRSVTCANTARKSRSWTEG